MILDNKNTNLKVHEWIAKYTKEGKDNTRFYARSARMSRRRIPTSLNIFI